MSRNTYKLFLLVCHQFGDFILASGKLLLVIREISNNELLFPCMQFKLFNYLLEERHGVQTVFLVLRDQYSWTRNNHVGNLLIISIPIMEQCPTKNNMYMSQIRKCVKEIIITWAQSPTTLSSIRNPKWNVLFSQDLRGYESTNFHCK